MTLVLIPVEIVEAVQNEVLNPAELADGALERTLEDDLARVDNRLHYGLLKDVFDLAAAHGIAQGHCFSDGNRRTACRVMQTCLDLHGLRFSCNEAEISPVIIRAAQRRMDEVELALCPRDRG